MPSSCYFVLSELKVYFREVGISDTDENSHLNEGSYFRFMIDAFYKITKCEVKSIKIKSIKALYKKEIRCEEKVKIQIFYNEVENCYISSFLVNDVEAFQVKFDFI